MRMRVIQNVLAVCGSAVSGFIVGVLMALGASELVSAQPGNPPGQPPAASQAQEAATAAPSTRVFASDAGMVLNFIKPDKAAGFEDVMAKLREALQKSGSAERKQQAAGWKVFRALEPGANGSVLYVFKIDPAVHGVDYTVSKILAEGFPEQVQEIFKKYADSYASGQNIVNLRLVSAFGQ